MSNYTVGVKIKLEFDKTQVNSTIDALKEHVKKQKVKIELNISDEAVKGLERIARMSEDVFRQVNKKRTIDIDTKEFQGKLTALAEQLTAKYGQITKMVVNEFGKVETTIENGTNKTIKFTHQLDKAKEELIAISKVVTQSAFDNKIGQGITADINARLKAERDEKKLIEDISKAQAEFALNARRVTGLFGDKANTVNRGFADVAGINALVTQMNAITHATPNAKKEIDKITLAFRALEVEAKIAAKEAGHLKGAMTVFEMFKNAMVKFPVWMGATTVFFGTFRFLEEAVTYIRNFDTAMVDLKKVTDESTFAYQEFEKEAVQIGQTLAKTSIEVVNATANFAKMGFGLAQSKQLAQNALLLSNVGDVDVNKSSEYLIATMKGFKLEAQDTIKIVDILNEVQNNHAISIQGLGEAYKRSSSVMSQAGNSLEQTAALITSANAVVQDPEKVGNGFKTIAMRIRGVDEESGEVFPKLEGLLGSVGVKIRKTSGEFRSTYEILKDLSNVWNSGAIDDMTKANILEQVAGKYQANVLASVLQNFSEAEKTYSDALNSNGSAMQENEKYMQSITAKVQEFKIAMEELYTTLMSSDLVKGFIALGTDGVKGINDLIKTFDGLAGVIGIISIAVMTLNTRIKEALALEKLRESFTSMSASVTGLFTRMTVGWNTAVAEAGLFRGSLTALGMGFKALKLEVIATQAAITLGLSLVITVITEGIVRLIEAYGELSDTKGDLNNKTLDENKTLQDEVNQIKGLSAEYEELSAKTSLTTDEKLKLKEVQEKLVYLLPQSVIGYDNEGNAIIDVKNKTQQVIAEKERLIQINKELAMSEFGLKEGDYLKDLEDQRKKLEDNVKKQQELQKQIEESSKIKQSWLPSLFPTGDATSIGLTTIGGNVDKLKEEFDNLAKSSKYAQAVMNKDLDSLAQGYALVLEQTKAFGNSSKETILAFSTFLVDNISELKNANLNPSDLIKVDGFQDVVKKFNTTLDEYKKGIIDSTEYEKRKKDIIQELIKVLADLGVKLPKEKVEAFIKSFLPEIIEQAGSALKDFLATAKELDDSLGSLSGEIGSYNQLLQDMAEKKKLNASEIFNLTQKYPKLLDAITIEGNHIKINADMVRALADSRKQEVQATIYAQEAKISAIRSAAQAELGIYSGILDGINNLVDARKQAFEVASKMITIDTKDKWGDLARVDKANEIYNKVAPYVEATDKINKAKKQLELIKLPSFGANGSKSKSGTGKSATQVEVESFTSALQKAKTEYSELLKLISRKQSIGLFSNYDAYSDKVKAQEGYVNKLFDIPSELDQKIKEYTAKLGKYKPQSKEYQLIQAQITKINNDKKQTLALQDAELKKLEAMKISLANLTMKNAENVITFKLKLGVASGQDVISEKLNVHKDYINALAEKSFKLDEKIQQNDASITSNQNKYKKNLETLKKLNPKSQAYKDIVNENKNLISSNNVLIAQNKNLNAEKDKWLVSLQSELATTNKLERLNSKITKQLSDNIITKKVDFGMIGGLDIIDARISGTSQLIDESITKIAELETNIQVLQEELASTSNPNDKAKIASSITFLKSEQEKYNETVKIATTELERQKQIRLEYASILDAKTQQKNLIYGISSGLEYFNSQVENARTRVSNLISELGNIDGQILDLDSKLNTETDPKKREEIINQIKEKQTIQSKYLVLLDEESARLRNQNELLQTQKTIINSNLITTKLSHGLFLGSEGVTARVEETKNTINTINEMLNNVEGDILAQEDALSKMSPDDTNYWKIVDALNESNKKKAEYITRIQDETEKLEYQEKVVRSLTEAMNEAFVNRKINTGVLFGFDRLDARLERSKGHVDDLLNDSVKIDENIANIQAAIIETSDPNQMQVLITKLHQQEILQGGIENEIRDANIEYQKQRYLIEKIRNETNRLQSTVQGVVDKARDISVAFRDSIRDIGININLNENFGTDMFGTTTEFFDSMITAYKTKYTSYYRFIDDLKNIDNDLVKSIIDLKNKQSSGGLTDAEEALLQQLVGIQGDAQFNELLQKYGLTAEEFLNFDDSKLQDMVDIINKQKQEKKEVEDRIKAYEEELAVIDAKANEQDKINQAKEKELKLTQLQADLDDLLGQRRFEMITAEGERVLTYDRSKAKELEKQKEDLLNEIAKDKEKAEIENKKEAINEKIKLEKEYLEVTLPDLQKKELEKYVNQWDSILAHQSNFVDSFNQNLNSIFSTLEENFQRIEDLYSTWSSPDWYSTYGYNQSDQYIDYNNMRGSGTTINIGNISITGDQADYLLEALQYAGLTSNSY